MILVQMCQIPRSPCNLPVVKKPTGIAAAGESLMENLSRCVEETGREFVFIIDEWDALIREAKGDGEIQSAYLNLLRGWFKNNNCLGLLIHRSISDVPMVLLINAIMPVLSTYSDCKIFWNPLFPGFKYVPIEATSIL